ncbi:unnamed protein product [Nezara viridula]|uniref:Uncharacterized protein n=1 Tax=Nezara viridula TaxID=85310 RepID=A0A9P0HJV3_NEZVI|nr:unnamed protein product [Nezara viridula]
MDGFDELKRFIAAAEPDNYMWLVMGSGGRENSEVRGSQKTPAVEAGSVEKLPVEGSLLNEKAS